MEEPYNVVKKLESETGVQAVFKKDIQLENYDVSREEKLASTHASSINEDSKSVGYK